MLRVRLDMDPQYADRAAAVERAAGAFRDCGVEIGPDVQNPDVSLVHDCLMKESEKAGAEPRLDPIIVFERQASATLAVGAFQRKLIEKPNVLGWVKEHALRDAALHNAPMVDGRHHNQFMRLDGVEPVFKKPMTASEAALAKIGLAVPHYLNPMFDDARQLKSPPFKRRRVDLMYSGTVKYDYAPLQEHRMQCCRQIQEMSAGHRIVGTGRAFRKDVFYQVLTDTKAFVSPYGWGEYSWKDYEAVYAGCVLIKPTSNFVETFGFDVFSEGKYCIECKPDFSDLQEIFDDIAARPEHYEAFAANARSEILKTTQDEAWAPASAARLKAWMDGAVAPLAASA